MPLRFHSSHIRRSLIFFITIMIVLVCMALGRYVWQRHYPTYKSHPSISKQVITYSVDTPSEIRPTEACGEYSTDTTLPERISIPEIGISTCVIRVGLDQHGSIATPDNIYLAGWYVSSAGLGQSGLSIINGYSIGKHATDAVFQNLSELKTNDTLTVTLGGGRVLTYEVYKEQSVVLDKVDQVVHDKDPGVSSQLNLVTCGNTSANQQTIISASLR